MPAQTNTIEFHDGGPDHLGRRFFTLRWWDETPPYCGECGADPRQNCGHYGPRMRGQCFFTVPPVEAS